MNSLQTSRTRDILLFHKQVTKALPTVGDTLDPFRLLLQLPELSDEKEVVLIPRFDFFVQVKKKNGKTKRRLIGDPNESMRRLHRLFQGFIENACAQTGIRNLVRMPSARAYMPGSDPLRNAEYHGNQAYFYTLDLLHAYDELDTNLLVLLLVAIVRYPKYELEWNSFMHALMFGCRSEEDNLYALLEDPLTERMQVFVNTFCRGPSGRGLVTGAPSSPYLFNLYAEIMLDASLRKLFPSQQGRYTRYGDDLTFSSHTYLFSDLRKEIRKRVYAAGFRVNHQKSKVLYRKQGTVFVTGFGLQYGAYGNDQVVFPGKRRRKLQGLLRTALRRGGVDHDVLQGHIADFKHYTRGRALSNSDRSLVLMCQKLERHGQGSESTVPRSLAP